MAENVEKLLTKEFINWAAEKLDVAFFKKGIPDVVDRPVFDGALTLMNNGVSKKIADEFKPELWEAQVKIMAADYDDAVADAVDELLLIVADAPYLTDKVKGVLTGLLTVVRNVVGGLD